MCIFGTSRSQISVESSLFINNTATFGGGVSMSADPTCTQQELATGCFSATFDSSCNFTGNRAQGGGGGAMYWTSAGNLNVSCNATRLIPLPARVAANFTSVPDTELPCSNWMDNTVTGSGYGPVVASSAFYLQPQITDLSYYSSNQPLPLTVFMQVGVNMAREDDAHVFVPAPRNIVRLIPTSLLTHPSVLAHVCLMQQCTVCSWIVSKCVHNPAFIACRVLPTLCVQDAGSRLAFTPSLSCNQHMYRIIIKQTTCMLQP